jgi:DNA-binding transcriptional regulator YhcF (GntR family)
MLSLDAASATPPYEQLRLQIAQQVTSGQLPPGAQLLTVRRLAEDLGVAPNTVARAYKELELEGYVRTGGRRGTVVADQRVKVDDEARRSVADFTQRMKDLGVSPQDTLRLVRSYLQTN